MMLSDIRGKTGYAVLISDKGFFIAHKSILSENQIFGQGPSGKTYLLDLVGTDAPTQLCLLQAELWNEKTAPVKVIRSSSAKGGRIIAVTLSGPVAGDMASGNRFGIIRPSNRYLPLSEVKIETPKSNVGGAVLFSEEGALIGLLSATLASPDEEGASAKAMDLRQGGVANQKFGPSGLTVTYSLSPEVLDRVVNGFLSPGHKPEHPNVGLQFKDNNGLAGVLVESVSEGLAADLAGIEAGDVIISLDGKSVTRATQFASMLFRLELKQKISLKVIRGGVDKEFSVIVGKLPESKLFEQSEA